MFKRLSKRYKKWKEWRKYTGLSKFRQYRVLLGVERNEHFDWFYFQKQVKEEISNENESQD